MPYTPILSKEAIARRKANNEELKRNDLERANIEKQQRNERLKSTASFNLIHAPWFPVTEPNAMRCERKQKVLENKSVQPAPRCPPTWSDMDLEIFGEQVGLQLPTPASTPSPSPSPPSRVRPAKICNPLIKIQHKHKDAPISRTPSPIKKSSSRGPMPIMSKTREQAFKRGSGSGRIINFSKPATQRQLHNMNKRLGEQLNKAIAERNDLWNDLDSQKHWLSKINQDMRELTASSPRGMAELRRKREDAIKVMRIIESRLPDVLETIARLGGDPEEEEEKERRIIEVRRKVDRI
jgi:hypothetical protein